MSVASDVRVDSLGYLVGSFVGEGTSRAVHLLSSDTGLVAGLVRRYRRDLIQSDQPWAALAQEGIVTLGADRRPPDDAARPRSIGRWSARPWARPESYPNTILLHGSRCGWRGCPGRDHRRSRSPDDGGPRCKGRCWAP